jgi:hypothetical protein
MAGRSSAVLDENGFFNHNNRGMKRVIIVRVISMFLVLLPSRKAKAFPWEVVKQAIIKAIKAADLRIQRLQNQTIWLQNAQKELENVLSKTKMDEIGNWVEKNREQYTEYFDELKKVKLAISGYQQVKAVIKKQMALVNEYKHAFSLFRRDSHFSARELTYMQQVYNGIIDESLKNLDKIYLVINSYATEMTDGRRLELIDAAADGVDENLNDLRSFNASNRILSIQRAKDEVDLIRVKSLYGLP